METQATPQQQPMQFDYGKTYPGGVHFFQGLLHWDHTRWLVFISPLELKRYQAGDVWCVKLRPERGEVPRVVGDVLEYSHRRFYRDPVVIWDDRPAPKSLAEYIQSPNLRILVRTETRVGTEVRSRFERTGSEHLIREVQLQRSEIPIEEYATVQELMQTKFSEEIAEVLREKGLNTTYGSVDRLKRRLIRRGLWEPHEVEIRNAIRADEESLESTLELANHLLERSTQAMAKNLPIDAEELRKNALAHISLLKILQQRLHWNYRRMEDVELGRMSEQLKEQQERLKEKEEEIKRLQQQAEAAEVPEPAEAPPAPEAEPEEAPEAEPAPRGEDGDVGNSVEYVAATGSGGPLTAESPTLGSG